MRILLIAYACEPDRGSEPAVGWNFAEMLSLNHEVHVLTRSNNRNKIEPMRSTVHWHYFDTVGRRLKRRLPFGIQAYHYVWQVRARREVRRILTTCGPFDYVQHVTLGSLRYPSAASVEGVRAVIGPVGGAETPPSSLWRHLGYRGLIQEGLRATANRIIQVDPLVRHSFRRATLSIATSNQSARTIRALAPELNVHVQPSIGLASMAIPIDMKPKPPGHGSPIRIISVGRQEPWKGFAIQLKALALLRAQRIDARLTLLGAGNDRRRLISMCRRLGISDAVVFIDQVPSSADVVSLLVKHNVFLFTSMRESGGMALIEAMGVGLPAIALAIGGPALTLDGIHGALVPAGKDTVPEAAAAIAAMRDSSHWVQLAAACQQRVMSRYAWDRRVSQVHETIVNALKLTSEPRRRRGHDT